MRELLCGHTARHRAFDLCDRCYERYRVARRHEPRLTPDAWVRAQGGDALVSPLTLPAPLARRICRCGAEFNAYTDQARHCSLWCAYPRRF